MEKTDTLKGRDFLTLGDFSSDEIMGMLEEARRIKALQKRGTPHPYLAGQTLAMIFEKSSTRTRVSFEVGMLQLGGQAIFLSSQDLQLGRGESISDTAKVLSGYVDGIMIRTFAHETIQELADAADIPVINGLTDRHHPAQVLADLLTVLEHKGRLQGLKMAYIGDGNNMANSLVEGASLTGMRISVACPAGYGPAPEVVAAAGGAVSLTENPRDAVQGADVVVTDVWASMGQEAEQEKREQAFADYQVNAELAAAAAPDFMFLHCLPAHRGEEVTAEVIDGPHSFVFTEAENRLHAQKAILKLLLS